MIVGRSTERAVVWFVTLIVGLVVGLSVGHVTAAGQAATTSAVAPYVSGSPHAARSCTNGGEAGGVGSDQFCGRCGAFATPLAVISDGSSTRVGAVVATNTGERTYDWRKLGDQEFENYFGVSAEEVKKEIVGRGGRKYDLYVDKCTGEIFVLRKGGTGEPQPTGYRVPR